MANPNAIVDFVAVAPSQVESLPTGPISPPQHVTISFRNGRSGWLDLSKPHARVWASVLDSIRQADAPAYVEVDPSTSEITNVLVPLSVGVENITPVMEDTEVELVISHAKHFLRATNPYFQELLGLLESARANKTLVAVTETQEHDIIDVRPLPGTSVTAVLRGPPERVRDPSTAVSVTLAQAQQMFDLVSPKICCPATAAAPCIPFNYPDDGCWGTCA